MLYILFSCFLCVRLHSLLLVRILALCAVTHILLPVLHAKREAEAEVGVREMPS